MMPVTNILVVFILSFLFVIEPVVCDSLFYMQRIPSSCVQTTLDTAASGSVSDNCYTFNWDEFKSSTTYYTTYKDPTTNATYRAQIGALIVLGKIDNYNLSYQCPPAGYNGVAPGCRVLPNTQLVVMHINVLDGKLYAIDTILSGDPFPSPNDLKDNQPPFGKARHVFSSGVTIQSTGYFKICKNNSSDQCPNKNLSAHVLPNPLTSNYGYGIFASQTNNITVNSTWIMDDTYQLLIVTLGSTNYYFNKDGFYFYDAISKTCTWSTACNYYCEVYNYNSRFLDYAGEWTITNKWSLGEIEPVTVDAWIGNAIDAAGIFPIILYTQKGTGYYLGLDKLDPIGSSTMGAIYWYTKYGATIPKVTYDTFHPTVVEAGCTSIAGD